MRRRTVRPEILELYKHVPNTGIIEKIKSVSKEKKVLEGTLITPKIARDLITLNVDNRPIVWNTVLWYTKIMQEGGWMFNGEPISITSDMKLINGQKRLIAIIRSNTSQPCNIQTGLSPDAFGTIDAGQRRSPADSLAIKGFENYNVLAAAIKAEIYFRSAGKVGDKVWVNRVSTQQIEQWVETENIKKMVSYVELATNELHKKGPFLSGASWAFLTYTLSEKHKGQAEDFISKLATGENISRSKDPQIYFLREKLMQLRQSQGGKYGSTQTDYKFRLIMRAWNLWRKGVAITKLSIRPSDVWTPIEKPV